MVKSRCRQSILSAEAFTRKYLNSFNDGLKKRMRFCKNHEVDRSYLNNDDFKCFNSGYDLLYVLSQYYRNFVTTAYVAYLNEKHNDRHRYIQDAFTCCFASRYCLRRYYLRYETLFIRLFCDYDLFRWLLKYNVMQNDLQPKYHLDRKKHNDIPDNARNVLIMVIAENCNILEIILIYI